MAATCTWQRLRASVLVAGFATACIFPASAVAAAPSLVSPSAGAQLTEGTTTTFSWSGSLQGDAGTKGRSYFRVEVAPSDKVPAGTNAEWDDVELQLVTDPGASTTSLTTGAPSVGNFKWRVCAMGVEDSNVSNAIVQLDCSSSRALAVVAAPANTGSRGEQLVMENEIHVPRSEPAPAPAPEPAPQPAPEPEPAPAPIPQVAPARTELTGAAGTELVASSPVSLDITGSGAGSLDLGLLGGAGGSLIRGLTAEVPGLGLPLWALVLPVLTVPFVIWFGRSTSRMFDLERQASAVPATVDGAPGAGTLAELRPIGKETVKSHASRADAAPENAA